tara:strand:- start:19367 stop:19783 length:417 start_codon:yes stop_codon:yes gene_type:complete
MQKKINSTKKINDKNGNLLAIIINSNLEEGKKKFHTSNDLNFQIGTFNLNENDTLERHIHHKNIRTVEYTSEALVILEGKLIVSIFDEKKSFISSHTLTKGHVALFLIGGHSFKIDEDTKFIEIKQGPFQEGLDKEKF